MEPSKPAIWRGVVLMISAWVLFACMSACIKHSYTHTTTTVAFFFQNFGALLALTPYFLSGGKDWLGGGQWGLIALRSILGGLSFYALFYALMKIPLTDGTLLNNTAPLFVPFFAALFLKTPLRLPICLSAIVGFMGVILILKPSGGVLCLDALPALFSGVASAFVMIVMRLLVKQNPRKILFCYQLLTTLAVAPFAIPGLATLPQTAIPLLLCVGVLFGLAQLLMTWSYRHAEPTVLAPFTYTFVVVSGLLDWILWDHAPGLASILGILLVLTGGILTIRHSRKKPESIPT